MYKLTFYVPQTHVELVKQAIFEAGAGKVGNYGDCCWQVLGAGQFRPLEGANPYIGEQGALEEVQEWCVECVVRADCIQKVVDAMKAAHPYETVAYFVVKLEDF